MLGGTLAVLGVLLLDHVFAPFADAVSLSQARRLAGFLPFGFALAGGAAVLARLLSYWLLPVALGAGILLEWAWPGDFGYRLKEGGPTLAGLDRGRRRAPRGRARVRAALAARRRTSGPTGCPRRRARSSSCR